MKPDLWKNLKTSDSQSYKLDPSFRECSIFTLFYWEFVPVLFLDFCKFTWPWRERSEKLCLHKQSLGQHFNSSEEFSYLLIPIIMPSHIDKNYDTITESTECYIVYNDKHEIAKMKHFEEITDNKSKSQLVDLWMCLLGCSWMHNFIPLFHSLSLTCKPSVALSLV